MVNILLNNQRIDLVVYGLDTTTTLSNRIAWILNTLPEYLVLEPQPTPDKIPTVITAYNLWELIQDNNTLRANIEKWGGLFPESVITTLWMAYYDPKDQSINEDTLKIKRRTFKVEQDKILNQMRQLDALPTLNIGDFQVETKIYKYYFKFDGELEAIFNLLQTTPNEPIITLKNIYKIQKNFIPPLNWDSPNDYITIKYLKDNGFVDVNIYPSGEENEFYLIHGDDMKFQMTFPWSISRREILQQTGNFTVDLELNQILFGDVLVEREYRDMLAINDNTQTFRNLFFENPYDRSIKLTCSISHKIAGKSDIYPFNTAYTVFRVSSCTNSYTTEYFRYVLTRALYTYVQTKQSILNIYNLFNIEVIEKRKPAENVKFFLKDIDKLVFAAEFSKKCQPKQRVPKLLPDDEKTDRPTFTFPKDNFQIDDQHVITPKTYYCPDDVFKFPGIIKNPNSVIGFQPCCFKVDQRAKKHYLEYYTGEVKVDENTDTNQYFKKSDKLILENQFGFLPEEAFPRVRADEVVVRRGVRQGVDSFLSCVLLAYYKSEQSPEFVRKERRRLKDVFHLGIQEMYDMNQVAIYEYLDSEQFLDPRKVLRIVEEQYRCNILVFTKPEDDGGMMIPRHINGYYKRARNPDLPSVFIYMHAGQEYPHCELLVNIKRDMVQRIKDYMTTMNNYFPRNPMSKLCWKVYDEHLTYYAYNRSSYINLYKVELFRDVLEQSVDDSGKVRRIRIRWMDTTFTLDTSPLPPMNVMVDVGLKIELCPEYLLEPLENLCTQIDLKTENLLTGRIDNVEFTVYFKLPTPIKNTFIYNQQLARYLTNWSFYYVSQFYQRGKSDLEEFMRDYILIDPTFEYAYVGYYFTQEDGKGILKDGKIVCKSREVADRLLYQIRLLHTRNKDMILNYHKRTYLKEYYANLYDYSQYRNETIVYFNRDNPYKVKLHQLLTTSSVGYLYPSPRPRLEEPYFALMNDEVYYFQNIGSLQGAVREFRRWNNLPPSVGEGVSVLVEGERDVVYQLGREGDNCVLSFNEGRTFSPLLLPI
jgi:hypothetical protein